MGYCWRCSNNYVSLDDILIIGPYSLYKRGGQVPNPNAPTMFPSPSVMMLDFRSNQQQVAMKKGATICFRDASSLPGMRGGWEEARRQICTLAMGAAY